MVNYLIIKPTFSVGNIGDAALLKVIRKQLHGKKFSIPDTKAQLKKVNIKRFDIIIYIGNDCIPYYFPPMETIKKGLNQKKKVYVINTSWSKNPKQKNVKFLKNVAKNPNFQMYMRDEYSLELIQKDIKFHNKPILTADLAFLCDKNNMNGSPELENWIGADSKPIIGINIHKDFGQYNELVRETVREFIESNRDKYRYLFIPHDSRKNEYEDLCNLRESCNDINGYTCKIFRA